MRLTKEYISKILQLTQKILILVTFDLSHLLGMGVMEYWSSGVLGSKSAQIYCFYFSKTITPALHYSNAPIGPKARFLTLELFKKHLSKSYTPTLCNPQSELFIEHRVEDFFFITVSKKATLNNGVPH